MTTTAREDFERLATGNPSHTPHTRHTPHSHSTHSHSHTPLLTELQSKHEAKMASQRDELELRRKTEVHEVEEVRIG